MTTTENRRR